MPATLSGTRALTFVKQRNISTVAMTVRPGNSAAMKPATVPATAPESPAPSRLRYEAKPKGSWKKIVGSMKDCDLAPEAFRLGAEWRADEP